MRTFDVLAIEESLTGVELQMPERPFPLKPGTGFAALATDDGYPVKDENDLIYMANILWGRWINHDVTRGIFNGLMEGDFYGG
jgi:hypothetical protein